MLDENLLQQVRDIFTRLDAPILLQAFCGSAHPERETLTAFLTEMAACSPFLDSQITLTEDDSFYFDLLAQNQPTGVRFRGIPNGHEFSSLLLAILNANGKGKNFPDAAVQQRICALATEEVHVRTYVSLTCTNCPDVVQTLNLFALLNPRLHHEMIDGALFPEEVEALHIQGVPAVFIGDQLLHSGRGEMIELLQKLETAVGKQATDNAAPKDHHHDVVVLGGGPAGAAAAIYSARKGLKVAVVAGRIGGQVKDTTAIENLISVPQTTGTQLADALKTHLHAYPIDLFENRAITTTQLEGKEKCIEVEGGERFYAPAVILATGASWRQLHVPGEKEAIGHGVHFCPHCDGPFYKNKRVAVVGGGNSGIEAAIDLAGICQSVTVLEFADTLRADEVLQQKAAALPNLEIFTSRQTTEVVREAGKVSGLKVLDRTTQTESVLAVDGVFVQIGLAANSAPFADQLELTRQREVVVDATCRTAIPGVYAAGDVTNVAYKQIIIAMGEGAKAALSAFDDRVRGIV